MANADEYTDKVTEAGALYRDIHRQLLHRLREHTRAPRTAFAAPEQQRLGMSQSAFGFLPHGLGALEIQCRP